MRVEVDIDGIGPAVERFQGVQARADDFRPVMRTITAYLRGVEREQFETSGARGGRAWRPDTEKWQARKAKQGYSTLPERMSDALMRSLTREGEFFGAIRKVNRKSLEFGTSVFYARFQRRRPLLGNRKADTITMTTMVARYVMDGDL